MQQRLIAIGKKGSKSAAIDYATFAPGIAGIKDTGRDAAKTYFGAGGRTTWCGYIRGSGAILTAFSGSQATGAIIVSIDDGPEYNAPYLGNNQYQLFKSIADKIHKVTFHYGSAYGTGGYLQNSGTAIKVIGAKPDVITSGQFLNMFDSSGLVDFRAMSTATYAGYVPSIISDGMNRYSEGMRIRTDSSKLLVFCYNRYFFISVDGGDPIRYDRGPTAPTASFYEVTLDGQLHTYNIWCRNSSWTANVGALSVAYNGTLYDVGNKYKLDQFGDSITEGAGITSGAQAGEVDVHGAAAYFGRLGGSFGWSGEKTGGLKTRLPTLLPTLAPTVNDVAILAIGRNDTGAGWTAQVELDYANCIDQLIAVYGKVLCRGIIPEGNPPAVPWSTENTTIAAIVAGKSNPNIIYINTDSWTDVQKADGTHPNEAGYATMREHCKTAYASYL